MTACLPPRELNYAPRCGGRNPQCELVAHKPQGDVATELSSKNGLEIDVCETQKQTAFFLSKFAHLSSEKNANVFSNRNSKFRISLDLNEKGSTVSGLTWLR